MGFITGLKNIEKAVSDSTGSSFFKLKDGQNARVRFLQELDTASPNYNEQAGLGVLVLEHSHPVEFKRRAVCTMDTEGQCWACEQRAVNDKWRPRGKLYINVLVKDGDSESVKVLNQGMGPRSIVQNLIDAANDYGSITAYEFKIKRTGSGMSDTAYTLTVQPKELPALDPTEYQLVDVTKLVHQVPYEQQEAFFNGSGDSAGDSKEEW